MTFAHHSILIVLLLAVLAPLLAEIPIGLKVPVVVLEVILGVIAGPEVLGLVRPSEFTGVMFNAGMAAVLFMAGMEIDFERVKGAPIALALTAWLTSLAIAFLAVVILKLLPDVHAPTMVMIALATTGLGTILPMLRDGGKLETATGRLLFAAGTIGELGPILAVSLTLSTRYSTWQEAIFLIVFIAVVMGAAALGMGVRPPRIIDFLARKMKSSTQLPVRLALLAMALTFFVSEELGFEGILGAFAAGMVIGLATRGESGEAFRTKIEAVCFGWFTPFFFVGTGVSFQVSTLFHDPLVAAMVPLFMVLFLAVRGLPTLLYGNRLPAGEKLPFALNAAVPSIGLVIVVTQAGLRAGTMEPEVVQALIAAALLATLLLPTLASALEPRAAVRGTVPE